DEQAMGIKLPETIALTSRVEGNMNDLAANLAVRMPEGEVRLEGTYINTDQIAFNVDLMVEELQLNELLQNDQLDALTFDIHAEGKGSSLQDLDAILTSDFKKLSYNNSDYSGIVLEGKMNDGN